MNYQATYSAPFGVLGIGCTDDALTGISFLPPGSRRQSPRDPFAHEVCEQLARYFDDPDFQFSLSFSIAGTTHQKAVWAELMAIPRGQVTTYGAIAARIHSAAQAVGQACGANPIPIIVPCHRVVASNGLGGFMRQTGGAPLNYKQWLLMHERR